MDRARGSPVAAITYDAELADQEPFVHAAGAAAVMRLERFKLEAELRASAAELAASRTRLKASTAELAASRTRLVETAYSERRRIERDLHDSVQQDLVGLRIKLDMVAEAVKEDPSDGARMIASMGLQMDHVLEALRSLARGIYPAVLAERGLDEALKSAARRCPEPVTVDARRIGRYQQDVEVAVYFCCLEALQNVAKHAGPNARASIRLRPERNELTVEVRDTGNGFRPEQAVDNHGLRNMRDRIEAVGGTLSIHTLTIDAKGHGTLIRAVVPARSSRPPRTGNGPGRTGAQTPRRSELVADRPQEIVPRGDVGFGLNPQRRPAIDDAEDPSPGSGLADDHLHGVRRGAEDPAHLGHELDLIEHVDREPLAQEHDERVPGADLERVAGGQLDQLRIVSRAAHQPRARGLAEGDSEPQPGTAPTSASCRSSTVLMKCDCPRIRFRSSGLSMLTTCSSSCSAL